MFNSEAVYSTLNNFQIKLHLRRQIRNSIANVEISTSTLIKLLSEEKVNLSKQLTIENELIDKIY